MVQETAIGGPARDFPATRWTLILAAREDPLRRRRALEELLAAYWKPLYAGARRRGLPIEDAKDAVQGLFSQLLDRDFPAGLDPSRGPLRAYLKAALQNHLVNRHEADAAQKRGGGRAPVPLDFEVAERHVEDREDAFDREWAAGVMERALARLRAEIESSYAVVRPFFAFGEAPSYADAARDHAMTVPQLKALLHRARVRFREIVRQEVAETAAPGEVDAEIAHLLRVLAS